MIRTLRRIWKRLIGSVPNQQRDRDLNEELEAHIELLTEENIRQGMTPQEAHRRARLQFGGLQSTIESYHEQRGLPFLDSMGQDLRYSLRGMRKNPGFAVVAILSLAVGIGANTAIFSLLNSVLLRPLAFKDASHLYSAGEIVPQLFGSNPVGVNPVHAREWGKQCRSIEQIAIMRSSGADLASGGIAISVPGLNVPHNLFALLGVAPMLGRTFLPEEELEGSDRVVILSESLWRSRFDADPALVGKDIVIDRQNYQVVGILPDRFRAPYGVTSVSRTRFEIFRPLVLTSVEASRLTGNYNYTAIVRLAPGATVEAAVAEMNVVQARFPRPSGVQRDLTARLIPIHELVTGRAQLGLWMLAAAVGAVLLIVCLNLANLLLSRMASRSRETAIRSALGASRSRQVRMLLTESLLLAALGGIIGILVATWSVQLLAATTTLDIPRLNEVGIDSTVLLFAMSLTMLTGLLFGALPSWRMTRNDPQEALRAGSQRVTEARGGMRLRETLIGLEVGLSTTLLIVAGLLAGSFTRLMRVDKGFAADRVITTDLRLSGDLYTDPIDREMLFNRLLAKVAGLPGTQASAVITQLPVRGQTWNDPIYLEGSATRHVVDNRYASAGYFRAMDIPIVQGRGFEERDRGRGVAVLSQKAARLLWPGETDLVGRSFMGEDDKLKTLVGVVGEVRAVLHREPPPTAYYPYWQRVPDEVALIVRTTADPNSAAALLRDAISSEDPQLPIRSIQTMEEIIDGSVAQRKFQAALLIAFAASALLVASLGIYGVVSYSVSRRRNEIGIRIALGAQRSRLLRLVIYQGMKPVALGLAAGLASAFFLGRAIRGLLFEIQPGDPITIAAVVIILVVVGVLACLVPARRAAATDPIAAIRFE